MIYFSPVKDYIRILYTFYTYFLKDNLLSDLIIDLKEESIRLYFDSDSQRLKVVNMRLTYIHICIL